MKGRKEDVDVGGKAKWKDTCIKSKCMWMDNIKIDLRELGCYVVD
jgi:hypothetical protein